MRRFNRVLVVLVFLSSIFVCAGQTESSVNGNIFRNAELGLTYIFPAKFSPKINNELPHSADGFEYLILALWDSPKKDGIPQLAFLHDTRQRPANWSRQQIAEQYLGGLRKIALQWKDAKVSDSKKLSSSGHEMRRFDYRHSPDAGPAYNAAIVIPLKDRSVLSIQLNASSQNELDDEVNSLRQLQFDHT